MRITKVECLVLANEHPIVRLETDEGLVGWGECFRRARALVKPAIEQVFRPALVGQSPLDTEVLHRRLMGMGQVAGPAGTLAVAGAVAVAVAGVDIALWDLKGKALGRPIWQLLGGRVRARGPVYASSLRRGLEPAAEAARVAQLVAQGYRAYKLQKIAVLAQVHGKPMTVHNTQPTLCTAAHLHFCAV